MSLSIIGFSNESNNRLACNLNIIFLIESPDQPYDDDTKKAKKVIFTLLAFSISSLQFPKELMHNEDWTFG